MCHHPSQNCSGKRFGVAASQCLQERAWSSSEGTRSLSTKRDQRGSWWATLCNKLFWHFYSLGHLFSLMCCPRALFLALLPLSFSCPLLTVEKHFQNPPPICAHCFSLWHKRVVGPSDGVIQAAVCLRSADALEGPASPLQSKVPGVGGAVKKPESGTGPCLAVHPGEPEYAGS